MCDYSTGYITGDWWRDNGTCGLFCNYGDYAALQVGSLNQHYHYEKDTAGLSDLITGYMTGAFWLSDIDCGLFCVHGSHTQINCGSLN